MTAVTPRGRRSRVPFACAAALALLFAPARAFAQAGAIDDDTDPAADDDDREPPPSIPPIVGVGASFGAMYAPETAGLNEFLARAGLGAVASVPFVIEPQLTLQIGHVVLPLRARVSAASSGEPGLDLDGVGGLLGFGYSMLRRPNWVLFPSLSFGIMRTRLSAGQAKKIDEPASFATLVGAGGPTQLSRITVISEAAFDAQFRLAGQSPEQRGLYFGAKVGLTAALADAPWTLDHSAQKISPESGPRAPVSGPLAGLSLTMRM